MHRFRLLRTLCTTRRRGLCSRHNDRAWFHVPSWEYRLDGRIRSPRSGFRPAHRRSESQSFALYYPHPLQGGPHALKLREHPVCPQSLQGTQRQQIASPHQRYRAAPTARSDRSTAATAPNEMKPVIATPTPGTCLGSLVLERRLSGSESGRFFR